MRLRHKGLSARLRELERQAKQAREPKSEEELFRAAMDAGIARAFAHPDEETVVHLPSGGTVIIGPAVKPGKPRRPREN